MGDFANTNLHVHLVSSTLIRIPNYGSVLLDCGEGTWGQLIRLYGDDPEHKSGVWEVLRDIKCIFLSHVHGDHHIGLSKLLSMRSRVCNSWTEYSALHLFLIILTCGHR